MPQSNHVILVADDENSVGRFTKTVLEEAGFEVVEAQDGIEAYNLLLNGSRIGMLVTDVMMPGMNGFALAASARKALPELPILFLTAYVDQSLDMPTEHAMLLKKPCP